MKKTRRQMLDRALIKKAKAESAKMALKVAESAHRAQVATEKMREAESEKESLCKALYGDMTGHPLVFRTNVMTNQEQLILEVRAQRLKCAKEIGAIVGGRFLLAGGALTKDDNPKDFDIYGVDAPLDPTAIKNRICQIYHYWGSPTRNAMTTKIGNQVVQFCKYFKTLPQKTIEAFDFAHCQAGAIFSKEGELLEVVSTSAFWLSEKMGSTWYTGNEYPLSSLMRCMKFHKRGLFKDNAHKSSALMILHDIVERGFVDEEDFDDQCASISESFLDFNSIDAQDLFDVLLKKEGN